ncbi:hypothetical protein GI374_03165 [Paracoccus sp. S-4012]|nr:hypothetical protein [Paracoccus sp. S-4012]
MVPQRNESRPGRPGAEQLHDVTGERGVIPEIEAGLVLQGAALPCALQPRQRGAHLLESFDPQPLHALPARLGEGQTGGGAIERSLEADMMLPTEARRGNRDRARRGPGNREPEFGTLLGKDFEQSFAAADAPVADHPPDPIMINLPDVEAGQASGAVRLGRMLQLPVRQDQLASPCRITRIRPAEAMIQSVLQRRPELGAAAPRRMGVDAAEGALRRQDAARHRNVQLEPTGMGVRRDIGRRPAVFGDPGKRHHEEETERDIDLSAEFGITGIERSHVDVDAGE